MTGLRVATAIAVSPTEKKVILRALSKETPSNETEREAILNVQQMLRRGIPVAAP